MADNYDDDVKMGKPLYMKFKVVEYEVIYDMDTHEEKAYFVYCRNPMGCYLTFPMEEFIPEIGTEFSIRFDWGDE